LCHREDKEVAGRYSRANVEGKEVVRKDLPMVTKTSVTIQSPIVNQL
jgi:hypothetical protein